MSLSIPRRQQAVDIESSSLRASSPVACVGNNIKAGPMFGGGPKILGCPTINPLVWLRFPRSVTDELSHVSSLHFKHLYLQIGELRVLLSQS